MGIEELRPPELEDKIVLANNLQIGVVSNKLRTKKRQIALNYLSWIIEKKQIQAVLSPERYHIDVIGKNAKKFTLQLCQKNNILSAIANCVSEVVARNERHCKMRIV
ncbi:hypothetical protein NSTC745_04136 [Nostoc sp. DSM 114161]|jgi:hypothetical protein|uniref:hypothetical protein n=1 Tax=Nostoc sp. DSM 114161 TaxID=3440143 RepID=UPI004045F535